jgi:hypothetical protein
LFELFQSVGSVRLVPEVRNARQLPPPMSVNVTLLPVPQVVANA